MKNLKQVLALGMAFSLTMSTMAGAAFTDSADVKATEAVNMLSALGVIKGYEDGSFKPEGTVTRAEAAKMLFTIRNGGNDDASAWVGSTTSFTDLAGYGWAEGYIKYCQTMGIIAGKSATTFDPGAQVTGTELAKMVLVSMGYNAETAGLTGATWATKTLALAGENGILDDVNSNLSAGLPRQYAAQLLYNGLNADVVTYENGQYKKVETTKSEQYLATDVNGNNNYDMGDTIGYRDVVVNKTLGSTYMDLETTTVLNLKEVNYDSVKGTYTLKTTNGDYTKVTEDYSALVGQKVNILHKKDKTDAVYGVYAHEDSTVVLETVVGSVENKTTKIKVDGTEYKVNGDSVASIAVYAANDDVSSTTYGVATLDTLISTASEDPYTVKFIDNNGDGKIDLAVVAPFTVAKVTYVGSTSITVDNGIGSLDLEDVNVYEGIAKDDYVAVTAKANTVNDKVTLTKADVVTGTIDAVKDTNTVKVGDNWYKYSAGSALTSSSLGSTVKLQVVNGYYFNSEVTLAQADTNLVYISAADTESTTLGKYTVKAKGFFADGTNKTITIDKVNNNDIASGATIAMTSDEPTTGSYSTSAVSDDVVIGMVYRYTVDSDGNYELYAMDDTSAANRANYDKYGLGTTDVAYNSTTERLTVGGGSYVVPDDAVIFVQTTKGTNKDTKVVTGKALKNWNWGGSDLSTAANLTAQILVQNVDGIGNIKVMTLVNATNNAGITNAQDTSYGYVVEKPVLVKKDGSNYVQYVIWNGTENATLLEEKASTTINEGDFVKYDVESADKIANVSTAGGAAYAITGITGNIIDVENTSGSVTTAAKIDADDTKVIYVNTADNVGVAGGSLTLANEPLAGVYQMNVYAFGLTSGNPIGAIFVDVKNVIDGTGMSLSGSPSTADVNTALTNTDSVTVGGALAPTAAITVDSGKTLTVSGALTLGTHDLTINGTLVANSISDLASVATYLKGDGQVNIASKGLMSVSDYKTFVANEMAVAAAETALKGISTNDGSVGTDSDPIVAEATGTLTGSTYDESVTTDEILTAQGVTYTVTLDDSVTGKVYSGTAVVAKSSNGKAIVVTEDSANDFTDNTSKIGVKVEIDAGSGATAATKKTLYLLVTAKNG